MSTESPAEKPDVWFGSSTIAARSEASYEPGLGARVRGLIEEKGRPFIIVGSVRTRTGKEACRAAARNAGSAAERMSERLGVTPPEFDEDEAAEALLSTLNIARYTAATGRIHRTRRALVRLGQSNFVLSLSAGIEPNERHAGSQRQHWLSEVLSQAEPPVAGLFATNVDRVARNMRESASVIRAVEEVRNSTGSIVVADGVLGTWDLESPTIAVQFAVACQMATNEARALADWRTRARARRAAEAAAAAAADEADEADEADAE